MPVKTLTTNIGKMSQTNMCTAGESEPPTSDGLSGLVEDENTQIHNMKLEVEDTASTKVK